MTADTTAQSAIDGFNDLIDRIEARCLAVDGPVTPTLQEMREDELAAIWRHLQAIRAVLSSSAAPAGEARAWIANDPEGGPYLTWSEKAARNYPNPQPLYAHPAPATVESPAKFKIGDRVTKAKGSSWTGRVVGTYRTALTPEGYAVESETESGSVQIYPASALAPATEGRS